MIIDFFKMLYLLSEQTLNGFMPAAMAQTLCHQGIVYDDAVCSGGGHPVLLSGIGNCDTCCDTGFQYTVRAMVDAPKQFVEIKACGETIVVQDGDWNFIDLM